MRERAYDRGASPLRKRRAVGQPASCQSTQVHRSRRAVIFLRYVQSVRDRTCCSRARDAVRRGQRRESERVRRGGCEEALAGRARRREETRRDEKGREEKGRKRKKKGKATRTGHARLSTRHLRVVRANHESRVDSVAGAFHCRLSNPGYPKITPKERGGNTNRTELTNFTRFSGGAFHAAS